MKKLSLLALLCAIVSFSFAQLPNGSYAENFTLYEINKTTGSLITDAPITLYDYTNAGKPVFIDVFATWCSPCWSYHSSGSLEGLYSQYGPNGTDELRVLGIEGSYGTYASLNGTGADGQGQSSQGNWLNGVEYPIIPLRMGENTNSYNSFHTDYAIAYFPTVYMVCPNRLVYEVGQLNTANLYASIASTCPQYDATLMNNALIISGDGINNIYFCSASANPTVKIQNVGLQNLTSATFEITCNGQTTTHNWTGNVAQYETATVNLPQLTVNNGGNMTYTVTITNVNGVADADPAMNTYSKEFLVQTEGTSTPINETFSNGIPSSWSQENGYLYDYQGSIYFNAYSMSNGVSESLYMPMIDLSAINTPAIKFDLAHARYSSSTKERLQIKVSTDCGNTWTSVYNKVDPDLATAGIVTSQFIPTASQWRTETVDLSGLTNRDNVIVKFIFTSGYGNIVWIDNVRVVDATGIEEISENEINIYPNPATSTLRISSSDMINEVAIYNLQGQLVQTENGNVQSVNISNLAPGSYIARIVTENGITNKRFIKE